MNRLKHRAVACGLLTLVGLGDSSHAELLGRDISGRPVPASDDRAVFEYDTDLNITWLRDWNYARTSHFSGAVLDGEMLVDTAMSWVSGLNIGGFTGWRLPAVSPVNGRSFQFSFSNNGSADYGYAKSGSGGGWGMASEMGHLYYVTLGIKGLCTPDDASPGSCVLQPDHGSMTITPGPFINFGNGTYLSGAVQAAGGKPFYFGIVSGEQGISPFSPDLGYAVPVRPGDVASVPEPQTLLMWLLGLGAGGIFLRRKPN